MKRIEAILTIGVLAITVFFLVYAEVHLKNLSYGDSISVLPDPKLTPGALNPNVTQENIHETICVAGWTVALRPPTSYTNALKVRQIAEYGYEDVTPQSYEEDHLISLVLGGSPTDPKNLWPQPYPIAYKKDATENLLHRQVCSGEITLAEAQKQISTNWFSIYTSQIQSKFGAVNLSNDPDDEI